MCENRLVVYFLLMFNICNGNATTLSQRYALRRADQRLDYDIVSRAVKCSSLAACTSVCSQDTTCLTVSFEGTDGRCLMSTDRVTHSNFAAEKLVTDSGWVTLSKAVYKAFLVRSPLGYYQAEYEDAVALCEELQTVLASPADLLESRALGLTYCSCGWLSDGTNGFVIQTADSICWGSFNTAILYCNHSKANAWCRL